MNDFLPFAQVLLTNASSWISQTFATVAVVPTSTTMPARIPGEPPTLALVAQAMILVAIYMGMGGLLRKRRSPPWQAKASPSQSSGSRPPQPAKKARKREAA